MDLSRIAVLLGMRARDEAARDDLDPLKAQLLAKSTSVEFLGQLGVIAILATVTWGHVSKMRTGVWVSVTTIWLTIVFLFDRSKFNTDRLINQPTKWLEYFACTVVMGGAVWGFAGVLMLPPVSLPHQLFVLFILAVGGVIATTTYAASLPSPVGFLIAFYAPLIIVLVQIGDGLHYGLATAFFGLSVLLVFYGRTMNAVLTRSFELTREKNNLARRLEEEKKLAEKANLAKGRFLSSACHDLCQPIHTIGLYVDALKDQIKESKVQDTIKKIGACVTSMDALFEDLQDIYKIEAGFVQPQFVSFPVASVLSRIEADFSLPARMKRLKLRVRPSRLVIHSDPKLLRRMVQNLVANAIRYTDEGGVLVGCRNRNGGVAIDVWDSGRGIPASQLQLIFEEFYQGGMESGHRTQGLGLGLAIVQRYSSLLAHRVVVTSRVGKGSCFSILVPTGEAVTATEIDGADLVAADDYVKGAYVVLIDDEPDVLAATMQLLQARGCHVVASENIEEVIQILSQNERTPDLILSDYRLGADATGIDAISRIRRAQGVEIPGVILTADNALTVAKDFTIEGVALLHKPLNGTKLRTAINDILRLEQERRVALLEE